MTMTEDQFEELFDSYKLDDRYAEYIEEHASIGNGTMLINAMESGDYFDDFKDSLVTVWN
jgi:hypothetical protein